MKKIDMEGMVFGRWTALKRDESSPRKWLCICECGKEKSVEGAALRKGISKSCGCLAAELTKEREKTHGMHGTKEWGIWRSMKNRAYSYASSHSFYYEERGIGVCGEWVESFEKFYEDMGDCPEGLTLERVDNRKGYSKDNCVWDTPSRQSSNRRKPATNTSGRIGVMWREDQKCWRVSIKVNGKVHNIGQFKDYVLACEACTEAEIKHLGYSREEY